MELVIDGRMVTVPEGITVAAALFDNGTVACRTSVCGGPRGALCAMGTCFECRVTVNGMPHTRACMTTVQDGMVVVTRA